MKPRTVIVQLEIRDSMDNVDQVKKGFKDYGLGGLTGSIAQVSVSVAQPSKAKKGKAARKKR